MAAGSKKSFNNDQRSESFWSLMTAKAVRSLYLENRILRNILINQKFLRLKDIENPKQSIKIKTSYFITLYEVRKRTKIIER